MEMKSKINTSHFNGDIADPGSGHEPQGAQQSQRCARASRGYRAYLKR
jgi:hypothetical protein